MRHLKRFLIFESTEQYQKDKQYIEDIFLEFTQNPYFQAEVIGRVFSKDFVLIRPKRSALLKGKYLTFSDMKDELLHLKSYLGDRWVGCSVVFQDPPSGHPRVLVDIDELTYDTLDEKFRTDIFGIVNVLVFFNL